MISLALLIEAEGLETDTSGRDGGWGPRRRRASKVERRTPIDTVPAWDDGPLAVGSVALCPWNEPAEPALA
jgi:hypothetical protein